MKILGLDFGDVWVGSAISDALGITCRPYKTIKFLELISFLVKTIPTEHIGTIVAGIPRTIQGGESSQTKKIRSDIESIQQQLKAAGFGDVPWILWDERLSSKRAQSLGIPITREEKLLEQSRAAAFILQNYLDGKALWKPSDENEE